jgi:hypothetical protein
MLFHSSHLRRTAGQFTRCNIPKNVGIEQPIAYKQTRSG